MTAYGFTVETLEQMLQERLRRSGIEPSESVAAVAASRRLPRLPTLLGERRAIPPPAEPFVRAVEKEQEVRRNPFTLLLDILGSSGFAVAGFASGLTHGDFGLALQRAWQGLTTFATGDPAGRFTFSQVMKEAGWTNDSTSAQVFRGISGLLLDIALDPLTYATFGVSKLAPKVLGLGAKAIEKLPGAFRGISATGVTLNKAGQKMLLRYVKGLVKEGSDLLPAVERAHAELAPFAMGAAGRILDKVPLQQIASFRPVETARRILAAVGRNPDDAAAIEELLRNGLYKFTDKGGLKVWGRTLLRGQVFDAVGQQYDILVSRFLVDPVARIARGAGAAIRKVPFLANAIESMREAGRSMRDILGKAFILGYKGDATYRRLIRLYRTYGSTLADDLTESIQDLWHIRMPDGTERLITAEDTEVLHRALHNINYYRHPLINKIPEAEAIYRDLPDELKPIYDRIRTLLDEVAGLEKAHGIDYETLAGYFPQKWKPGALEHIRQLAIDLKLPIGDRTWWNLERTILVDFDKAKKLGLEENMWSTLYNRLFAGRLAIAQQQFLQEVADRYGTGFLKIGNTVVERRGEFRRDLADYIAKIEALTPEGVPSQSQRLRDAFQLLGEGKLKEAIVALARAKPVLTSTVIGDVLAPFKEELVRRMDRVERAGLELGIKEVFEPHLPADLMEEIRLVERLNHLLNVTEMRMRLRSVNFQLRSVMRRPPKLPKPDWEIVGGNMERILAEVRKAHPQARRLDEYENVLREFGDIGGLKRDIEELKAIISESARIKPPRLIITEDQMPALNVSGLNEYGEQLRRMGFSETQVANELARFKDFGDRVVAIATEYRQASAPWRAYMAGKIPRTPQGEAQVKVALDSMEAKAAILHGARKAYIDRMQNWMEALADEGQWQGSVDAARSLFVQWKRLLAERQALNTVMYTAYTQEEVRAMRAMLEGKEVQYIKRVDGFVDNVTKEGELVRVPIDYLQVQKLSALFSRKKEALRYEAPRFIRAMTGKREITDLTFEDARQILEIASRQPAKVADVVEAQMATKPGLKLVPAPKIMDMRIKFEEAWRRPTEVWLPEELADQLTSDLSKVRPHRVFAAMLRGYDYLQDLWRFGVTTPFPAFHIRNMFDVTTRGLLGAGVSFLKPSTLREILLTAFGSSRPIQLFNGGQIPREAVREILMQHGLVRRWPARIDYAFGSPGRIVRDIWAKVQGLRGISNPETMVTLNAHRLIHHLDRIPGAGAIKTIYRASERIENGTILAFLIDRVQRGYPLEQAAELAEHFFFNYAALTNFEKAVMRRAIPFYGFTRQALPLTWTLIKDRPGFVSAISRLRFFGGVDTEIEKLLPAFIADSVRLQMPRKEGEDPRYIVFNNVLTIDWSREWAMEDTPAFVRAIFGNASPLLVWPIEYAMGRDLYFGADIRQRKLLRRALTETPYMKPFYAFMRAREAKIGGQTYLAVDGTRYWMLRTFWLSRLYSTLDVMARKDLSFSQKAARLAAGLILFDVDMTRRRDLLMARARALQNDFLRAIRIGDDVRARDIMREVKDAY